MKKTCDNTNVGVSKQPDPARLTPAALTKVTGGVALLGILVGYTGTNAPKRG